MSNKRCENCVYRTTLSNEVYCDYLGLVGHVRPCPPNKDCTVRTSGEKAKVRPDIWVGKGRIWSTSKAEALRAEGMTYLAIATELGTTKAAITGYFNQRRKADNM